LESVYRATYRGFKSLILRQMHFSLHRWAGDNLIKVVRTFA
jgi:hypothetical protein